MNQIYSNNKKITKSQNIPCIHCIHTLHTLQIFQKTTISHEFRNDIDRLFHRAHSVQLNQLGMSEFLHDLRFGQEVFWIHSAWLECLYRHWSGVIPQTFPHFAELTLSQFSQELQWRTVDFPLIPRTVTEAFRYGFLNLLNKARPESVVASTETYSWDLIMCKERVHVLSAALMPSYWFRFSFTRKNSS